MTSPTQESQPQEQKNDKEINFRALEARYQRQLEQANAARIEAERKAQEAIQALNRDDDDDDDDEPYIDHKKLNKTLAKFGEQTRNQTQSEIQKAVQQAVQDERKQNWIKNNNDFYDVLQHADKLAQKDPDLAESILEMPDNFERQKLVYKNIKAFGLHKPPEKQPSIQDKIDANKRNPGYQPSGSATAPYASSGGDYSPSGQKSAYQKMQELKKNLRI